MEIVDKDGYNFFLWNEGSTAFFLLLKRRKYLLKASHLDSES